MRSITVVLRRSTGLVRDRGGFALPAALAVLVLLSVLVVTVFANAMASFRSGNTDLGKARSHFAAEAGAESAMAQLADALEDAVLEDQEMVMITAPTMPGFTFDSFSIEKVGGVVPERITDGPFSGLWSLTQIVDVYAEASGQDNSSSAVVITAKAQAIPIFQFGIFYDKDLEITNGPRLDFAGWVHSNGSIYLSSNNQYFQDLITTPNQVYHDRKDRHLVRNGVYIQDASATDVQLTFDSRDTPNANDFRTASDAAFDNRLQTDAYGVDSLKVPLPSGMDPITIMQPRSLSDGALETQAKFAWKADWYIEVDMDALSDPGDLCAEILSTSARDDPIHVLPSLAQCQNIFTLTYDKWYEGREERYVDIIDVNMSQLFSWAGSDTTRITNIMYITFSGTSPDPNGDGDYPVVRMINATSLGNPFTIATRHPLYVQGNYNTSGWQPSALVGDAITFLSNAWSDGAHLAASQIRPTASNTNVYAAVLAGHSGTPCDHEVSGCGSSSPYGGGLENFPRFLESWSSRTLLYRGSLVSLAFSQQSTGLWGNGPYYRPPARDWEFDTRFEDPANLPPGTPVVGNVIHTAFRPIY
jgi:hypothetical protein